MTKTSAIKFTSVGMSDFSANAAKEKSEEQSNQRCLAYMRKYPEGSRFVFTFIMLILEVSSPSVSV